MLIQIRCFCSYHGDMCSYQFLHFKHGKNCNEIPIERFCFISDL